MNKPTADYLNEIADLTQRGDAREESYYRHLEHFLAQTAQAQGKAIQITILPKPTEAGNPDFRVWDGAYRVIGYVEAKLPGTNLDRVEDSEQLKRYRDTFPNLILTDFYEFRLYRQGVRVQTALLARPLIAQKLKTKPPLQQVAELERLLAEFLDYVLPSSTTSEELSRRLAQRTRFLRDQVVYPQLVEEVGQVSGDLYGFYEAFKRHLIADLTEAQFADLYAQTVTYGLFAARTRVRGAGAQGVFNRPSAFGLIPPTIGILRDVFQFISLGKPSLQMEVAVDDIAAVLNATDVQALLEEYYRQGKGDDPVLHFYETFLAAYDPETREQRGVYYTPQPVVGYIVRSVHHLLKTRFDLSDGLADERVTLLDPAAGTLTFPAEAVRLAVEAFTSTYGEGGKANFLRKHILPHFYAFELLMAPYAIGHMKVGFLLEALGIPLQSNERFQLYLTNALEMEDLAQTPIPGLASLSEESHKAAQVKKEEPILVILGNPPYSGLSANQNAWTERLLKTDLDGAQSYYTIDGAPLNERNPKWLQDDYVKFLRFAQWKIQKAGRGIVAMITNHSYLDNPTFRGMRQSLLKTFDEIYILDLHGNSLKRERAPDGSLDENVFDIRQGVAIAFFIKHGKADKPRGVYHNDLHGTRAEKYDWLDAHSLAEELSELGYQVLQPCSPYYFLVPRQTHTLGDYLNWPRVNDIFPVNSVGIVTARDKLTIAFTETELRLRVAQLQNTQGVPDEVLAQAFGLRDKTGWSLRVAREQVRQDPSALAKARPILYRPFDQRYIFYHEAVIERTRYEVMRHMLAGGNLGLITVRRCPPENNPAYFFVSEHIISNGAIRSDNMSIDTLFPLYTYPSEQTPDMINQRRQPNLADWLVVALRAAYGAQPTPEEIMAYVYAVFYSPTYRQRYAEMLRVDFPRVPFPVDREVFFEMAALGQQLIDLHLLRAVPSQPNVKYQGSGSDDTIRFVRYDPAMGRVAINADKYFEGITPEMWNYHIGGYQVLEKYLKDRRDRTMDDPVRYIQIARAIANTLMLQQQIDLVHLKVESTGVLSQFSTPDRIEEALRRGVPETALLSELALWDWMRPEEDEAWAHLQQRPSS